MEPLTLTSNREEPVLVSDHRFLGSLEERPGIHHVLINYLYKTMEI